MFCQCRAFAGGGDGNDQISPAYNGWQDKVANFGAIGNLVPQLHLHVVGRRPGDACWPAPVWGNLPEGETWAPTRVEDLVARLVATTGMSPTGTARNPGPPA